MTWDVLGGQAKWKMTNVRQLDRREPNKGILAFERGNLPAPRQQLCISLKLGEQADVIASSKGEG